MRAIPLAATSCSPGAGVALSLRLRNEVEIFGDNKGDGVASLLSEL
jgi:hypothetical protein